MGMYIGACAESIVPVTGRRLRNTPAERIADRSGQHQPVVKKHIAYVAAYQRAVLKPEHTVLIREEMRCLEIKYQCLFPI